jgi:predicted  nucleic acid-binding Zn-ribbon protein
MLPELENLINLQQLDLQIRAIAARLEQIPVEVAKLEKEVATEKANLETAQARVSESQKQRRSLEGELEQLETTIGKYKDQLMQVKTNEEYKAMQRQIENTQASIGGKEEQILLIMEEAEGLQDNVKARQKELEAGQKRMRAMEADLEAEGSRLRAELEKENRQREELLRAIDSDLIAQYQRVAGARSGIAMAEAKDEHCQVCHVRLRPQVYNEIRIGDRILHCDSCGRILYYSGPAVAGSEPQTDQPSEST